MPKQFDLNVSQCKYVITKFLESNTIDIIPTNWLDKEAKESQWPPRKWSADNVRRAVRNRILPDLTWESHPIKILYGSDIYEKVREKLALALETSDVATASDDDESFTTQTKRKRRANMKYINSTDDEEEEEDSSVRGYSQLPDPPPAPVLIRTPKPQQSTTKKQTPKTSKALFTTPHRQAEEILMSETEEPYVDRSTKSDIISYVRACFKEIKAFQKICLDMKCELKYEIKELKRQMQEIRANSNGTSAELEDLPKDITIPLRSMEMVDELEQKLQDKHLQDVLVKHVSITGGANVAEATRRMMGSLLSNELATQFNWKGKGEKRGFSKLLLSDIVLRSVRKNSNTAGATKREIEGVIKTWLRYAQDRLGRRKIRKSVDKKNQDSNINTEKNSFSSDDSN